MLPERYMPKKISQINKNDKKVSVTGKVVEMKADTDSFIIEDGSGKIEVFFEKENFEDHEKISSGKTIRAFCTLVGEQLKLDIAQDMTGADLNLLKTVDDLYSKAGV
jgi:uncharacterized protein YdeI (BOF family)